MQNKILYFNRVVFGALIFGLLIGVVGVVSILACGSIYGLIKGDSNWGGLLIAAGYVFVYCTAMSAAAFLLAGVFRKRVPKWDGYLFLILAALPINLYLQNITVFVACVMTVYFGEMIYRKTWLKISQLTSSR